jgi:hypothetical protein
MGSDRRRRNAQNEDPSGDVEQSRMSADGASSKNDTELNIGTPLKSKNVRVPAEETSHIKQLLNPSCLPKTKSEERSVKDVKGNNGEGGDKRGVMLATTGRSIKKSIAGKKCNVSPSGQDAEATFSWRREPREKSELRLQKSRSISRLARSGIATTIAREGRVEQTRRNRSFEYSGRNHRPVKCRSFQHATIDTDTSKKSLSVDGGSIHRNTRTLEQAIIS